MKQNHTRTHQDTAGLTKTHPASPQMPHELPEPLKTQNGCTQSSTRTEGEQAEPRSTIRKWKPNRQEQHRLPRTHSFASHARTKRFPGCLTHPTSDFQMAYKGQKYIGHNAPTEPMKKYTNIEKIQTLSATKNEFCRLI